MSSLPLKADVTEATISVTVSSAAGGAGASIGDTRASFKVSVHNAGVQPVDVQLGAGAWITLPYDSNTTFENCDLSATTVKTRKGADATANGAVSVTISSLAGTYKAGDQAVTLGA